jgi:hypothetical protein
VLRSTSFSLMALTACAATPATQTAVLTLENGASVAITETYTRWPEARRALRLTLRGGATELLPLSDAGGRLGSPSLNVYRDGPRRLVVAGERDCVEFDVRLGGGAYCRLDVRCTRPGLRYLGRFDWMNGVDGPGERDFSLGFRYLPAEQAAGSPACPTP